MSERFFVVAVVMMFRIGGAFAVWWTCPAESKLTSLAAYWLFLLAWDTAENNWILRQRK